MIEAHSFSSFLPSLITLAHSYGVVELTELLLLAKIKPAVNQIRYHAYNAKENAPLLALASLNEIVIEAYSSLSPITKVKYSHSYFLKD